MSSTNSIIENNITNNGEGMLIDYYSSNNNVSGNSIVANNGNGIWLRDSSNNNIIIGNNVTANGSNGISCGSSNSTIRENRIVENSWYGIQLGGADNLVSDNYIAESYRAIRLVSCSHNTISNNTITNSQYGIGLDSSVDNEITRNTITLINDYGIEFDFSSNNSVTDNRVLHTGCGFHFQSSSNNTILANDISNNNYGLWFEASTNNTIYHNNFTDNSVQTFVSDEDANVWDDGYPSGGNFWSDYSGADMCSGPYQNETGSDGLGDTPYTPPPYIINVNNTDHYPLTAPWPSYDVAVLNLTTSKTGCKPVPTVGENCTVSVNATIGNLGSYDENFTVVFYVGAIEIARENVSLAGREHTVISFDLNTTGWTKGNYVVRLYIEPVSGEANTTNNLLEDSFLVTMLGDINGDDKVDVKDVYATALAYGTSIDGPNPEGRKYHPNCDINNDLRVDVKDYYIVCKNYGRVDP
jgi:parallel beta-helix repeat protein